MGRTCNTQWGYEDENLKGRDHLEELDTDVRLALAQHDIREIRYGRCGVDSSDSE
jgi:hypothetical protein